MIRRHLTQGAIVVLQLMACLTSAHAQPVDCRPFPGCNWSLTTKTVPLSTLLPGCIAAPECSVTVRYWESSCELIHPESGPYTVCRISMQEIIWDPGCGCPFEEILRAVTTNMLTVWNNCWDSQGCATNVEMYFAGCYSSVPGPSGGEIAWRRCPDMTTCCYNAYSICKTPGGGYNIRRLDKGRIGPVCPPGIGGVVIGQCFSFCDYMPLGMDTWPGGSVE